MQVGDGRRDMNQVVTYVDSRTYDFGEEEEEEEEKPKTRPHYKRQTETVSDYGNTNTEPSSVSAASAKPLDIPTVSTTSPSVPSAPPVPKAPAND